MAYAYDQIINLDLMRLSSTSKLKNIFINQYLKQGQLSQNFT